MEHYATLQAYPIKEELGGGYRGVVFIRPKSERLASDVLPSLDAARNWAKIKAHEVMGGKFYRLAPLRRSGSYQSNLWV
jgi:hypothetical protein